MAEVPDPSQAEFRIPSGISSVGRKPSSFEGQAAVYASDPASGEDPNTTCVFKNVHWKPEGAAHNQLVTFCFDLKNEELVVDGQDARVACFPFGDITMSIGSREQDLRRKVVIEPWQNSLLREQSCGSTGAGENNFSSPRSGPGVAAELGRSSDRADPNGRATSRGGSRDAETETVTAKTPKNSDESILTPKSTRSGATSRYLDHLESSSTDGGSTPMVDPLFSTSAHRGFLPHKRVSKSGAGGEDAKPVSSAFSANKNTGWIFFVAIPDVAALSVTARDAGIVQTSFNATWRIVDYCGSGGCADVYKAEGDGNIHAAVKIPKQALSSQSQEDAEKSWSKLLHEVRAMRALQLSPHVPQLYGSFPWLFIRPRGGSGAGGQAKLSRARSRLYRSRILQVTTHLKALAEIRY